jgi:DNA primase catalytic core
MSALQQFRDFVEQVRAATDIAEVVGKDVDLTPSGSTLKGLSPFHDESHPSFTVWPSTQSWCDFSGNGRSGGDVFAYVQQKHGIGFKEAVYLLAKEVGIKLPNQDEKVFKAEVALLEERREVEKLLTKAAAYYHSRLPDKIRRELLQTHYGFSEQIISDLLLGWADGHLFDYFINELSVTEEMALKTGLFIRTKDGVKDFFQDRIVFPYWKRGQVVYFIARVTQFTGNEEWEKAKYKKQLTPPIPS